LDPRIPAGGEKRCQGDSYTEEKMGTAKKKITSGKRTPSALGAQGLFAIYELWRGSLHVSSVCSKPREGSGRRREKLGELEGKMQTDGVIDGAHRGGRGKGFEGPDPLARLKPWGRSIQNRKTRSKGRDLCFTYGKERGNF